MKNMKLLLGSLFVFSLGFVSADTDGCGMSGMMFGDYGFGGMFFGWIVGLLVIVALVLLVVWLAKQIWRK